MAVIKKHPPGTFCWTDLGSKNVAGAAKFYQRIFGWTSRDQPMGGSGFVYSTMLVKGRDACAVYPMDDEQRKRKAPPCWLPYLCVRSAARTARKAKAAGGRICLGPLKVMEHGRLAIMQDPTGATFGLWQPAKHRGAGLNNTPGTVCWHDLNTLQPGVAAKFYAKVFGWKTQAMGKGAGVYRLFKLGRSGVGGVWPVPLPKLPPSWLTYWNVRDCSRTVAQVRRLGGRVMMAPMTVPGYCRFAVLRDPQGAAFGVLQPLV